MTGNYFKNQNLTKAVFSHVSDLLKFFDNIYSLDSKTSNKEKKLFVENALTVPINCVIYLYKEISHFLWIT